MKLWFSIKEFTPSCKVNLISIIGGPDAVLVQIKEQEFAFRETSLFVKGEPFDKIAESPHEKDVTLLSKDVIWIYL